MLHTSIPVIAYVANPAMRSYENSGELPKTSQSKEGKLCLAQLTYLLI